MNFLQIENRFLKLTFSNVLPFGCNYTRCTKKNEAKPTQTKVFGNIRITDAINIFTQHGAPKMITNLVKMLNTGLKTH